MVGGCATNFLRCAIIFFLFVMLFFFAKSFFTYDCFGLHFSAIFWYVFDEKHLNDIFHKLRFNHNFARTHNTKLWSNNLTKQFGSAMSLNRRSHCRAKHLLNSNADLMKPYNLLDSWWFTVLVVYYFLKFFLFINDLKKLIHQHNLNINKKYFEAKIKIKC